MPPRGGGAPPNVVSSDSSARPRPGSPNSAARPGCSAIIERRSALHERCPPERDLAALLHGDPADAEERQEAPVGVTGQGHQELVAKDHRLDQHPAPGRGEDPARPGQHLLAGLEADDHAALPGLVGRARPGAA